MKSEHDFLDIQFQNLNYFLCIITNKYAANFGFGDLSGLLFIVHWNILLLTKKMRIFLGQPVHLHFTGSGIYLSVIVGVAVEGHNVVLAVDPQVCLPACKGSLNKFL